MTQPTIPAFLSVDVEPDGFQLSPSSPPRWEGFDALVGFLQQLRADLQPRCRESPRFGWYVRTDPQIAKVYGRASHVLEEFPNHLAQLAAEGDYFGVHMHPIRWSETHGLWVHDFADREWLRNATRFAVEVFADWAATPARRFRMGAGFMNNDIIANLDELGVVVELSLEPVAGWGLGALAVPSGIDDSPIVGSYEDCRRAPREAFRPSCADFRIPDQESGRRLLMVPHTTYALPERTALRRLAQKLTGRPRPTAQVLYTGLEWPSPTFFWDLAAEQLSTMRRPYLSLAIRTNAADVKITKHVRSLFQALATHPLSERLSFVDPLDVVVGLVH
jgi:hypothetical protein